MALPTEVLTPRWRVGLFVYPTTERAIIVKVVAFSVCSVPRFDSQIKQVDIKTVKLISNG